MIDFTLPALGADMESGKLLEWRVKAGDAVKRGDVIAVVDTSKAAVEVEIWQDGVVAELVAQPGDKLAPGAVMARIAENVAAALKAAPAPAPVPAPTTPSAPAPTPTPAAVAAAVPPSLRKPASPAARKHARDLDVDIETVTGTGPHGAVTIDDVDKAAAASAAPKPASPPLSAKPAPAPTTTPTSRDAPASRAAPAAAVGAERFAEMRKAIAAAMARSKREIPHYYLSEPIPMRRAVDWLTRENAQRGIAERVLMGALQLKAVALSLRAFPDLNGFWRDGAFQPSPMIHAGVAIALRQGGLVAPAIHDVDQLPLPELMRAMSDLVRRARAGSLRSSEMADPTITVTNLGDQGADAVFGVIYPPQVALVGFGRLAERPWAEDGALRAMPVVTASLAADHRVSDGHRGARFLADLRERLQHPETL